MNEELEARLEALEAERLRPMPGLRRPAACESAVACAEHAAVLEAELAAAARERRRAR